MKRINVIFPALMIMLFCRSCKKASNPSVPQYTIPTTYNFANFNDTNQRKLLLMADQIVAAINPGNTSGNTVSAQKLKDMFNNVNAFFTDSSFTLNGSGLKLADYCPAAIKTDMLSYFDRVGLYSQSNATADIGVAGIAASSANPAKKYLLSKWCFL